MAETQCTLEEIHAVELDLLRFFRNVCDKNGIRYRIVYGTLLGAVRHKGFIPWDDDIDVVIPVEDVKKFCRCFEEAKDEKYALVSPENEKYSIEPWLKIRRNNTTSMPKDLKDIPKHWGICMDIFPAFPVGGSASAQKRKILLFKAADALLRANTAKYTADAGKMQKFLSVFPTSLRRFGANMLLHFIYKGSDSSEYISDGFAVFKRSDYFAKKTLLVFENELFAAPEAYDSILTQMYGDYMTPPPEEERIGHDAETGSIIWDTENGPEKYR